jgi:hypothetical protein
MGIASDGASPDERSAVYELAGQLRVAPVNTCVEHRNDRVAARASVVNGRPADVRQGPLLAKERIGRHPLYAPLAIDFDTLDKAARAEQRKAIGDAIRRDRDRRDMQRRQGRGLLGAHTEQNAVTRGKGCS